MNMKMKYESPAVEIFDVDIEGCICLSGYGHDSNDSELYAMSIQKL